MCQTNDPIWFCSSNKNDLKWNEEMIIQITISGYGIKWTHIYLETNNNNHAFISPEVGFQQLDNT